MTTTAQLARKSVPTSQRVTTGLRHLTIWIIIAICLFPVMAVVTSAFSGGNDLNSVIPSSFQLDNFRTLFTDESVYFPQWARNTLIVCTANATINVLLGALGAYAFSRMRFKGRRAALMTLLLVQIFPAFLALSAIYYIMTQITEVAPFIGKGTLIGLILVYTGGAMGVNSWLIKGFFDTIPKELDESAMIDGASHPQIFFKIILPLAVPALAVVFMLSFIGLLNEFIIAATLLSDPEKQTLAVGLFNFIGTDFAQKWGPFTAGALLAAVPVVVIFIYLQKYIVSGLVAGSVKG
jgi:arabinogalactan oligomer / maltooligosaccharide transport system permease protein